jgi:hypothetical protein
MRALFTLLLAATAAVGGLLFAAASRSDLAGIRAVREVTVAVVGHEGVRRRVAEAYRQEATALQRCRRMGLVELGLVSGMEPSARLRVGHGRLDAAYIRGSDTVFVPTRRAPSRRHEYVHAVDDQLSGRMAAVGGGTTTDRSVALRAAIEGTAQALANDIRPAATPARDFDGAVWNVVYIQGRRFVEGRTRSHAEMLRLWPESAYEVMFGRAPPVRGALDRGDAACSDELGAAALFVAAVQRGASSPEAREIARGWAGDLMEYDASAFLVRWTVAFHDSAAHASWLATAKRPQALTAGRQVIQTFLVGEETGQRAAPITGQE